MRQRLRAESVLDTRRMQGTRLMPVLDCHVVRLSIDTVTPFFSKSGRVRPPSCPHFLAPLHPCLKVYFHWLRNL